MAILLDETLGSTVFVSGKVFVETSRLPREDWQITCKKGGNEGMTFDCDVYVEELRSNITTKKIVRAIKQ